MSTIFLLTIFLAHNGDAPEVRGARMPSMDACVAVLQDVAEAAPKGAAVICLDLGPNGPVAPTRDEVGRPISRPA